jgi:GxxExxY protein
MTGWIIRVAIKVHRKSGLLESMYHQCLYWELRHPGLDFTPEVAPPIVREDIHINKAYRAGIIVGRTVVLELNPVERIRPAHQVQTLLYLRLDRKVDVLD